jgi:RNA polymerase subunit RPABC4/transcription elongation factor Spt4
MLKTASVCPACGLEMFAHRPRIRCRACGRRVLADSTVCPNCGANPRAFHLPRGVLFLALGLVILVLLGGAAFFVSSFAADLLPTPVVVPTPEPTWTPRVRVLFITATPEIPTPAPTLIPTLTSTDVPLERLYTPTKPVAITPVRATPRATSTPTMVALPAAPTLIGPDDQTKFQGPHKIIVLSWEARAPLAGTDYYRVILTFNHRDWGVVPFCFFTQPPYFRVPTDLYDDAAALPDPREFRWNVTLVHAPEVNPSSCETPVTPLSATSATRVFVWY